MGALDIICIGEPLVEFTRVGEIQNENKFIQGFGGDTSNCAIAAARQNAGVGYFTVLGNDKFGEMYLQLWRDEGIDISGIQRDPHNPTGIYFIEPVKEGRDFTYYRKGSASANMKPENLPFDLIKRSLFLQTSAISQAISETACDTIFSAVSYAKKYGVKFAYDTNLRLNLWALDRARAIIHETARKADILLPSLDEARILTGLHSVEEIVDFYLAFGPKIVALKCGKDGAIVAFDGKLENFPTINVDAVDTSGAGDTFDGAFLARLAKGDDPFEAGRFAVVAAGLSTTGYGAVAPIPYCDAVKELLRNESR